MIFCCSCFQELLYHQHSSVLPVESHEYSLAHSWQRSSTNISPQCHLHKLTGKILCSSGISHQLLSFRFLQYPQSFVVVLSLNCVQLYCDPMVCSPPRSSVHGIFQARILGWVAISFSRGSAQPRDWTCISCIASRSFTTEPLGKPLDNKSILIFLSLDSPPDYSWVPPASTPWSGSSLNIVSWGHSRAHLIYSLFLED